MIKAQICEPDGFAMFSKIFNLNFTKNASVVRVEDLQATGLNKDNITLSLRDSVASYTLNYLYVPLPKNANTQMKRFLWSLETARGFRAAVPDDYFGVHNNAEFAEGSALSPWRCYLPFEYERFHSDTKRLFTFSVVRNPYSKLLSGYLEKIGSLSQANETERLQHAINYGLPGFPTTFDEFVEMVCSQSNISTDIHWKGQKYRLAYDFFEYDYIGYFEDLPKVFGTLQDRFLTSSPLIAETAVHATSAQSKVSQFYDSRLSQLVADRYRDDFEAFGYADDFHLLERQRPIRDPSSVGVRHELWTEVMR